MLRSSRRALAVAAAVAALVLAPTTAIAAPPGLATNPAGQYIVTFAPSANVSAALHRHDVAATYRFDDVLNGFAADLTTGQLAALRSDPNVVRVEPDVVMRTLDTQFNPP